MLLAEGAARVGLGGLRVQGHQAVPPAATHVGMGWTTLTTRLLHKTVATRAGLGWIGKCALVGTRD